MTLVSSGARLCTPMAAPATSDYLLTALEAAGVKVPCPIIVIAIRRTHLLHINIVMSSHDARWAAMMHDEQP